MFNLTLKCEVKFLSDQALELFPASDPFILDFPLWDWHSYGVRDSDSANRLIGAAWEAEKA